MSSRALNLQWAARCIQMTGVCSSLFPYQRLQIQLGQIIWADAFRWAASSQRDTIPCAMLLAALMSVGAE